ncbi:hypothetical protein JX265_009910 [Neoarthrinium moseri]|uniref:FAD dependent oxidoreductase domain-containing protein n=1 Tax=Neoarthrinium moseri TaxID=1658444 RepID=A0A9P9WF19_9PEZI|nr:uncharacterized protein JN550_008549 [Neoarthrinium moseri]KAI1843171.1 hypothetical protein JX266_010698 [Neoarthrinium moseri]KAI1860511.1 hypothetical protein JX265_009910 [Neoarthrinium moseri]KAI1865003.1 hypothetical protein JN550_008549 [Neoarthrinium moseri]
MGGGEHHPGLPVPNPVVSYWQVQPHRIAEHRTTPSLPTSELLDFVIVGSGISGAAIAYKLLSRDPSLSILMLEARTAASGASGRNGGHCRAGWWLNYKRYKDTLGEDEALKFLRLEEDNVKDIADFVRDHNIDCDFVDLQSADTYVTEEAWANVKEVLRMEEEVRERRPDAAHRNPRKVYEGKAAQDRVGIPNAVGAVTWPAHVQNPYRLVCRMLELALDKGLNLQTNTPVHEVTQVVPDNRQLQKWVVKTPRGTVHAKGVILATNAYTNAIYTDLATTGFLRPGRSQVTAVRPGSKVAGNPALRLATGLNDVGFGDYFHVRAPGLDGEGDVIYGGGRFISREEDITDDSKINDKIATYLRQAPRQHFGRENWGEQGKAVMDWTGITCYTPDTFPLVGEAPGKKGLWMSVGMNGHGMAMAFRSAEALVHIITTGTEPEWFPRSFKLARAWSGNTVHISRPETGNDTGL